MDWNDTVIEWRKPTAHAQAEARRWLKAAKKAGIVAVLGGGWWKIDGWTRPVQGFAGLALGLMRRGIQDPKTGDLRSLPKP